AIARRTPTRRSTRRPLCATRPTRWTTTMGMIYREGRTRRRCTHGPKGRVDADGVEGVRPRPYIAGAAAAAAAAAVVAAEDVVEVEAATCTAMKNGVAIEILPSRVARARRDPTVRTSTLMERR